MAYGIRSNEDGRQITAREYLETALRPVAAANEAAVAKNGIRASIAALFPVRDPLLCWKTTCV